MEKLSWARIDPGSKDRLERIERELADAGRTAGAASMPVAEREGRPSMPLCRPQRKRSSSAVAEWKQAKQQLRPQPGRHWSTAPWPTSTRSRGPRGGPQRRNPRKRNLCVRRSPGTTIAEVIAKWTGIPWPAWWQSEMRELPASPKRSCHNRDRPGSRRSTAVADADSALPRRVISIRIGRFASFLFRWTTGRGQDGTRNNPAAQMFDKRTTPWCAHST